jgi:hypothetical protein
MKLFPIRIVILRPENLTQGLQKLKQESWPLTLNYRIRKKKIGVRIWNGTRKLLDLKLG